MDYVADRRAARRRAAVRPVLRPVCAAVAWLGACGGAAALPEGGTVTQGQVAVSAPAAGRMDLRQSTPRAAMDWRSFSIARGETLRIQQPGADAVLLNRVTGNAPSVLLGQLQSNGKVYLSNPRGIVFGAGGQVDVGGLVATTLAIDDAALQAGRFELTRGLGTPGAIEVAGEIRAAGTVALVAPTLDVAAGARISAPRIGLAAATAATVDVEGDGLVFFNLRGDDLPTRLQMLGALRADGGTAELRAAARAGVVDTVLNLDGIVQARSLGVREGRVVIDGGAAGVVTVGGRVDASGLRRGEQGGAVDVLGERLLLADGARIDASGAAGGGRLRIGGDYQGANPLVANAKRVLVSAGAELTADATQAGDGGRVIVWSDEATAFAGRIQARGGAAGGNGGFAEVSSKGLLRFGGLADLGAAHGAAGELLLDPLNITVSNTANLDGAPPGGDNLATSDLLFGNFSGATSQITDGAVETQLQANGGTLVRLQATNNINVTQSIVSSSGTLELRAGNNISIGADIGVPGGVSLIANDATSGAATGTGAVSISSANITSSGPVLIQGGGTHTVPTAVTVTGSVVTVRGNMTLDGVLSASTVNIESGTTSLGAATRLANSPVLNISAGAALNLGSFGNPVASLSLAGSLNGSGTLTAGSYALDGATVNANLGTGTLTSTGTSTLNGQSAASSVDVLGGTLTLGASDRLANTAAVTVRNGATLALSGAANDQVGSLVLQQGSLVTGSGTLSAATLASSGESQIVGNVGVASSTVQADRLTLGNGSVAGVLGGSTTVAAGATLRYNAPAAVLVGPLLGTGTIEHAGPSLLTIDQPVTVAAVRVTGSGTLALGGSVLPTTVDVDIGGAGVFDIGALSPQIGSLALAGRLDGSGTLSAGTYALNGATVNANLGAGTLTSTGATALNGQSAATTVDIDAGTLTLGAANRLDNGATVTVRNGATLNLGAFDDTVDRLRLQPGRLAGSGTLTATNGSTLAGATVDANLAGALLTSSGATALNGTAAASTVEVDGGTLTLGAGDRLANNAAVTVRNGATLALSGAASDQVGSLVLQQGSLVTGSGTLSAATLASSGESQIVGNVGVASSTVQADRLTLGNGSVAGTLTGTTTVAAGATLRYDQPAAALVGPLLGTGTIEHAGGSLLTIDQTVTVAAVRVTGSGTLALGGSVLPTTVDMDIGGAGVFDIGALSPQIGSLTLAGRLDGFGTLTAGSYALNGGTVNANLGTGTLTSTGASTLNGSAGATTVGVTGGRLALGGAERLANNAVVTVGNGAELALGAASETVGRLILQPGRLTGSGTLTASAGYLLDGGTVDANLGTGTLTSLGASTLNGTAASLVVGVDGGTLALGAADRLADGAAVTVRNGAVLNIGSFNELVASLSLQPGRLAGTGTLTTTGSTTLAGGTVDANLGGATLASTGASVLNGRAAALTVDVDGGTLALGAADRLADSATVTVRNGATLDLRSFDEGVGRLLLQPGRLAGSGTLSATLGYTLAGATVDANLGLGALTSTGGSALNGRAASLAVLVDGGTLTLGAANRLADAAAVTVRNGAVLDIAGFDDTVGSLSLQSARLAGSGTLTATLGTTLADGTVDARLAGGTVASSGASVLNGTAASSAIDVTAGTLTLGAAQRLASSTAVTVRSSAVLVAGGDETIGTLDGGGRVTLAGELALGAAGSSRFDGVIDGSGALRKQGATSVFTLGGQGTFTGATQVDGGTLQLEGTLASATLRVNAGTLALAAPDRLDANAAVTVARGAVLAIDSHDTRVGSLALAGTLDGSATLTAAQYTLDGGTANANLGAGTLTSRGDSRLNGTAGAADVQVAAGTLVLGAAERLADGAAVTVDAGAALVLGGAETLGTLAGQGAVDLGAHALATGAGGDSRFDGTLRGSGALLKQGGGRFVLGGANTHGDTTIDAGTLVLAGAGTLGTGAVHDQGVLRIERAGGLVLAQPIDGTGALEIASGAAAELAADHRHTGGTRVEGGATLRIVDGGSVGSGELRSDGSIEVDRTAALVLANRITGAGSLSVAGSGPLTLTADNDYAGGTRIAVGSSLQLGDGGSSGSAGRGDVVLDGTLRIARADTLVLANRLSGAGTLVQAGPGTLTLTGANTLTGRTTITAGTLEVGDGGTSGAIGTAGVDNDGVLRFRRADDVDLRGVVAGSGVLEQAGAGTLRLLDDNRYGGATRITAGTLQVGDGGRSGSLGSGDVANDGVLRFARADDVTVAQALTGSGRLEQAGSGVLTLSSTGNVYGGGTRVASGTLRTAGDERLPDSGTLQVDRGAALTLGGSETLGALDAAGSVELQGSLTTADRMAFSGALRIRAAAPVRLQASEIVADGGDNDFGAQPLSISAGSVRLLSGSGLLDDAGATYRDLVLGDVTLTQGGRIDASHLQLAGLLKLPQAGAALELRVHAAPDDAALRPVTGLVGPANEALALTEAVLTQADTAVIETAAGTTLTIKAVAGGSVQLERDGNQFLGGLSVLTGGTDFGRAWDGRGIGSPLVSRQDEVRVAGQTVVVGGGSGTAANGIEADVVYVRAGELRTEGPGLIAARLPYNNLLVGAARSLPALTLELTDAAFNNPGTLYTFGDPHGDRELAVQVGSRDTGGRGIGLNAGFVRVLPPAGKRGATAVYLVGPTVGGPLAYRFFDSGAGQLAEIPVLYNGFLPSSPQLQGSLSAVAAVSEQARKERFEEAVRTENVAVRLRGGVIAEVGPGRPATQGSEGIRLPPQCEAVNGLGCP